MREWAVHYTHTHNRDNGREEFQAAIEGRKLREKGVGADREREEREQRDELKLREKRGNRGWEK
jgi:hypothetical protein